jgi:hypothetical protein
MRELAVQALVDEYFASFEGYVSIQLLAKKERMDGIDHIIVLWGHDKNDQGELGRIEDAFKHQVDMRIANVVHSSGNDRGHLIQKLLSYLRLQSVSLVPGNPGPILTAGSHSSYIINQPDWPRITEENYWQM